MASYPEADADLSINELCRQHGFSEASCSLWRNKFAGMSVFDAKQLKDLEAENARLKKLLAESLLVNEVTKEALRKEWVRSQPQRALVRYMIERGLSERRASLV